MSVSGWVLFWRGGKSGCWGVLKAFPSFPFPSLCWKLIDQEEAPQSSLQQEDIERGGWRRKASLTRDPLSHLCDAKRLLEKGEKGTVGRDWWETVG
mmetsp:Transcript_11316/g.29894  ORF Transcript_11316/g.29894 Transcript_11316/m.29894 type:complete len:96 (-) Transcript_11316:703-990(-)